MLFCSLFQFMHIRKAKLLFRLERVWFANAIRLLCIGIIHFFKNIVFIVRHIARSACLLKKKRCLLKKWRRHLFFYKSEML